MDLDQLSMRAHLSAEGRVSAVAAAKGHPPEHCDSPLTHAAAGYDVSSTRRSPSRAVSCEEIAEMVYSLGFGNRSVFSHPLLKSFLRGVQMQRPVSRPPT